MGRPDKNQSESLEGKFSAVQYPHSRKGGWALSSVQ